MPDSFVARALARGSRSTALYPLAWVVGLCAVASIAAFRFGAPEWLGTMFGVLSGAAIALYLTAYVYFAATDKDALRSEKYSIQKLAIQKGFVGDDEVGYIKIGDAGEGSQMPQLPKVEDPS